MVHGLLPPRSLLQPSATQTLPVTPTTPSQDGFWPSSALARTHTHTHTFSWQSNSLLTQSSDIPVGTGVTQSGMNKHPNVGLTCEWSSYAVRMYVLQLPSFAFFLRVPCTVGSCSCKESEEQKMPTSLYCLHGTQEKMHTHCWDCWREKLFELKHLMGLCTQGKRLSTNTSW